MAQGIEDVKNRLQRAAAVRNTRDVDILLRREDMERAQAALEAAGFVHRRVASLGHAGVMDVFLDGREAKVREAVYILWAGEKAVPDALEPAPDLVGTEHAEGFELVALEALVQMKLTAFRDKDRMHLRDLASVGLIGEDWPQRFSAPLADRLSRNHAVETGDRFTRRRGGRGEGTFEWRADRSPEGERLPASKGS